MDAAELEIITRRTLVAAKALGLPIPTRAPALASPTADAASTGAVSLADAAFLSDRRSTRDGYMVASARAARTGIQAYAGAEVGRPDLSVVRIYRPDAEVFSRDSLSSYAHKPITNDHPLEAVSSKNWKQHAVGHVEGEIARDGEFVRIALMMADADAITALDAGKRELSVGYSCDLDWTAGTTPTGETYDARQTNIRVNHVALVDRGRAGIACRIGDAQAPPTTVGDKPMTTSINDAMQQIPSEYRTKMLYFSGRLNDDGYALEDGIRSAKGFVSQMRMNADGVFGGGRLQDSMISATRQCADHLEGKIAAAQQRLAVERAAQIRR